MCGQGVSFREQVARITVDLGKDNQCNGEVSGRIEDYGEQSQHGGRNAKERAADGGAENFKSRHDAKGKR